MSNQVVGNIYFQIINLVIESSQNDFEESGIDQATLQELKQKWKDRLSSYHVAHQPWDPPPQQNQHQNPPTLPSNVQKAEESPPTSTTSLPPNQTLSNGVRIKTEPGYENGAQSYSAGVNGYTTNGATIAQQRAANLLQQQYGGQTSPSMSHGMPQQQPGFALPGQPRPAGIQLPGQPQRPAQQQQYPPQQPQAPQQQRTPLSAAQTDGADGDAAEWRAIVAQNRSRSDTDRIGADAQIKNQIDQMTYQMDSGLMVPLAEQPRNPNRKRKLPAGNAPWSLDPSQPSTLPSIPQLDGVDEDDEDEEKPVFKEEEKDEDAINSDLDDSEDELNQVEADEDEGAAVNEAILCTYDKVQRVKNKWKCTLKDGILSTKGKDYLFHKAQGEFEW